MRRREVFALVAGAALLQPLPALEVRIHEGNERGESAALAGEKRPH